MLSAKRHAKKLRLEMDSALSYAKWLQAAEELDSLEGWDEWRKVDECPFFHLGPVKKQLEELQGYCNLKSGVKPLLDFVEMSLQRSMGDVTDPEIYTRANAGTKHIVEKYLSAIERALNFLADIKDERVSIFDRIHLFEKASRAIGRMALVLSGGATLGLFHLGVIKALLKRDLLPQIISGSSVGSIIAATACSKTDEELDQIFDDPARINTQAFGALPLSHVLSSGALMDPELLHDCIRQNVGDWTFVQAQERTGRVCNISVSPTRKRQWPRLLNYLTAPNLLLARTSAISCAVPGLFPPQELEARNEKGETIPYIEEEKWFDGSFHSDLPLERLGQVHNVNHFIVSQTNPHVLPFMGNNKNSVFGTAYDLVAGSMRIQAAQVLDVARNRVQSSSWRRALDVGHAVLRQPYSGNINIHPRFSARTYTKVLSNATVPELEWFILQGERATWPYVAMIRDRTRIYRTIHQCMERLQAREQGTC